MTGALIRAQMRRVRQRVLNIRGDGRMEVKNEVIVAQGHPALIDKHIEHRLIQAVILKLMATRMLFHQGYERGQRARAEGGDGGLNPLLQ